MLKINGKTFMNLQEAVQWLLDNNALPFQSSANYIANTEIGLGTIVNPSPAKVRIGSLIFFADSKVSTVTGLTENGFIVSDQYNDLVDDVVYVSNVALDGSGHLIVTLSNGDEIDAGLIKQISYFSINASQHLVATYNDGTTTDLGEIFNGPVTFSGAVTINGGALTVNNQLFGQTGDFSGSISTAGNLTVTQNATVGGTLGVTGKITGGEIVENMAGYAWTNDAGIPSVTTIVYADAVKNGNKLTLVLALKINLASAIGSGKNIGTFTIPYSVGTKLYPVNIGGDSLLSATKTIFAENGNSFIEVPTRVIKQDNATLLINLVMANFVANTEYYGRIELTFLLSDPLNP